MFIVDRGSQYDGQLTAIGQVMANLPLDVRLSKLILLGHVFGLLDDCVYIGSHLREKI